MYSSGNCRNIPWIQEPLIGNYCVKLLTISVLFKKSSWSEVWRLHVCVWQLVALCVSPCKCLFYEPDPCLTLGPTCNTEVLFQTQITFMCARFSRIKKMPLRNPLLEKQEIKTNLFYLLLPCFLFSSSFIWTARVFFKLSVVLLRVSASRASLPFSCDLASVSKKACMRVHW